MNEEISHLSNGVRAIEPSLSFDKRQFLTLDGEMDFDEDISTERVLYFDSDSKRLAVSLIYTDDHIGNDFLGSDWLAFTEKNHSNSFLISFKNILVMTTYLDEKEVDFLDINTVHELIIKELSKNL